MPENLENIFELIGSLETYRIELNGNFYVRSSSSDGDLGWWEDGNQGIWEYEIEDEELLSMLEEKYESLFLRDMKRSLLNMMKSKSGLHAEVAKDILNLGMTLRQNQLNGSDGRSGNEVLSEYLKKELKNI